MAGCRFCSAFLREKGPECQEGVFGLRWAGVAQGRRRDLVGGGLVRSLGGWAEAEKLRLKGQEHIKSDERILGDSDFVDSVLAGAEEHYCGNAR